MSPHLSLIVACVLWASVASAQTAVVVVSEPRGEDRAHLVMELGDGSQVDLDLPLAGLTPEAIRDAILAKRERRTRLVPTGTIVSLRVPPPPVEPPPPPPSPMEVWLERARRLSRMKALNLTNPDALTDMQNLEDLVNVTYRAGFSDGF